MVDFAQDNASLIETFAIKDRNTKDIITPLKAKQTNNSLSPEIPIVQFDQKLPVSVKDSIAKQQAISNLNRKASIQQQKDLGFLIEESNNIINDAEDNIEQAQSNLFTGLSGIVNDKYDVSFQRKRITQAVRSVQTKMQTNKIRNNIARLDEESASAELSTFEQMQKLKGQKFAMTSAEALAVAQSNTAKKAQADFQFAQLTTSEMQAIKASGSFNEVATEQRIDSYFASIQKAQRLADTAAVALSQSRLDYSQDLENDILNDFPVQYLRDRLDKSVEAGEPVVTLGKDFKLAPAKVMRVINEKNKLTEDFRVSEAKRAVAVAKNNVDFLEVSSDISVLSAEFTGNILDTSLQKVNLMNVTDDTLAQIDLNELHPALAGDYLNLLSFQNNLNNKSTGITPQDIATQKELLKTFKDKASKIKKTIIDSQPTKALKAAQNEWFSNSGRMKSGINASAVVAGNISTMPDFGGDTALIGAWTAFAENVVVDISGESVDFLNEDGGINQQAFLETTLAKTLSGKQTDQDRIIKNMNVSNAQGQTPLSIYTGIKAKDVLIQAVRVLAENNAAIKQTMFDGNGRPNGWENSGAKVAELLATLSFKAQKDDPSLSNNFMNFSLQAELDNIIASNIDTWNMQNNIGQGSFMVNLFKGRQPFQLVDTLISTAWGTRVNPAWNLIVRNEEEALANARPERPLSQQRLDITIP